MTSPYAGLSDEQWLERTTALVGQHPLSKDDIVSIVQTSWDAIFESTIGPRGFKIGVDIRPKPQIIGFLLHELLTLETESRFPGIWRGEVTKNDKDLVHIPDDAFSIEIKTSSHKSRIFGNRSYAQKTSNGKKAKSGYYLAINFEKFSGDQRPKLTCVRFGWLDSDDWIGQKSATGQQSSLPLSVERGKLLRLFPA